MINIKNISDLCFLFFQEVKAQSWLQQQLHFKKFYIIFFGNFYSSQFKP